MAKHNAAIIPVIKDQNGILWIYLPVEAKKWHNETIIDCLTTFGGGVKDEDAKLAAARELEEESDGIFLNLNETIKILNNTDQSIHTVYSESSHNYDIRYEGIKTKTDVFFIRLDKEIQIEDQKIDNYLESYNLKKIDQNISEKTEIKNIVRLKLSDLFDFFSKSTSDNDTLAILDNDGNVRNLSFVSYAWASFNFLLTEDLNVKLNSLFQNSKSSTHIEELEAIRCSISAIREKMDNSDMENQKLIQEKNQLEDIRDELISRHSPIIENPIEQWTGKTSLKKKDKFFHVIMGGYKEDDPSTYIEQGKPERKRRIPFAGGIDVIKQIMEKGVARKYIDPNTLDHSAGNFGLGEYGPGLYCNRDLPAYISPVADKSSNRVRKPYIIVFEVKEQLDGIYSRSINEFLRENTNSPETVIKNYNALLTHHFIAHSNGNSEINIRNPNMCIVPIGIYEPQNIKINRHGNFDQYRSQITPIENFCLQHNILIAPEWHNRLIKALDESNHYFLLKDKKNNKIFFKTLRANVPEVAIHAEVGASHLASILIDSKTLIPPAQQMKFDGMEGLTQPYIEFDSLSEKYGHEDGSVKFHELNKKQRTQFFAHLLINWVISNQDSLSHNFDINKSTGDIISFDKGQAFKMFVGSEVTSPWVKAQLSHHSFAGPEAGSNGKFYNRNLTKHDLHIEYQFMQDLQKGKFDINWRSPFLREIINNINKLDKNTIKYLMQDYAKIQYPGQEEAFYNSIRARARSVKKQVLEFSQKVPECNYDPKGPIEPDVVPGLLWRFYEICSSTISSFLFSPAEQSSDRKRKAVNDHENEPEYKKIKIKSK